MSIEENKALVRRFLEAHASGDVDSVDEMLAPDFVDHNVIPGQQPGREGYLRALTEYHGAYSHTRYVIEKQLAEGDEVVTTFAVSAIHDRGEWMGLVPTGTQFEALLILVHRVVEGKITDEWTQGSGLAELTQRRLEQEMRERERVERCYFDDRNQRLPGRRGRSLGRLARGGTGSGQRSAVRTHPAQHVRDLLLCHPGSQER